MSESVAENELIEMVDVDRPEFDHTGNSLQQHTAKKQKSSKQQSHTKFHIRGVIGIDKVKDLLHYL